MVFRLQTIKKRADFLSARNGRYFATPGLVLQVGKKQTRSHNQMSSGGTIAKISSPRFGFTATKKLGNAVVRNRVKRRMREAVRLIAPQLARNGYEYVLIGRKSTLKRPFSSLLRDLTIAFGKVHGNSGQNRKNHGRSNTRRPHKDRR